LSRGSPVRVQREGRVSKGKKETSEQGERLTRTDGPMVESLQAEGLTLRVGAKVRLESVGVDDGDVSLNGVEGRSGLGNVLGDVPTTPSEHLVDGRYAILWCLDLDKVDGL
jgi:hypothetical protein